MKKIDGLFLKEIKPKDLKDCKDYIVMRKGHKLERMTYTEQDNGNMWMHVYNPSINHGHFLESTDKIFELPYAG